MAPPTPARAQPRATIPTPVNTQPTTEGRRVSQSAENQNDPTIRGAQVRPDDVLLGRSKESFNHPGNVKFRQLIGQKVPEYMAQTSRYARSALNHSVFDEVIAQGRFLESQEGQGYVEVEKPRVLAKIGHAIRDKAAAETEKKRRADTTSTGASKKPAIESQNLQPLPRGRVPQATSFAPQTRQAALPIPNLKSPPQSESAKTSMQRQDPTIDEGYNPSDDDEADWGLSLGNLANTAQTIETTVARGQQPQKSDFEQRLDLALSKGSVIALEREKTISIKQLDKLNAFILENFREIPSVGRFLETLVKNGYHYTFSNDADAGFSESKKGTASNLKPPPPTTKPASLSQDRTNANFSTPRSSLDLSSNNLLPDISPIGGTHYFFKDNQNS